MTTAPDTGRTAEEMRDVLRGMRRERDSWKELAAENGIAADRYARENALLHTNLIALAKMYGEACGELQLLRRMTVENMVIEVVEDEEQGRELLEAIQAVSDARDAAAAEIAQLRSRLLQAEKGGEISGRDPDGSGHPAEPEPASGLSPSDGCPSRMQWQPIATAPTDRPIVVRMPSKSLPGGWFVVTAQLPDPDDDSRFSSCSTIYHYNGAVLMGGFRGTWTHWREDAPPPARTALNPHQEVGDA